MFQNLLAFSNCSEKFRPKPVVPPSTLKMEGELMRKSTSVEEHYTPKPYSRELPMLRKGSLSVSTEDISMARETTYKKASESVLGSPLKVALRHDPQLRRHDQIDWM